jgi:hypothetical protein
MDSEPAGKVLGVFALYCCEARTPTLGRDLLLLKTVKHREKLKISPPVPYLRAPRSVIVSLVSLRRRGRASLRA